MNKILAISAFAAAAAAANAGVYTLSPSPTDLNNLDHGKAYTWGIPAISSDERVVSAVLYISEITNWLGNGEENKLFMHLLDNPAVGTQTLPDNTSGLVDFFLGQGAVVGEWSDPNTNKETNNLTYNFSSIMVTVGGQSKLLLDVFNQYLSTDPADGLADVGFGFDPDCHYYNSGVTFVITTEKRYCVPEAGASLLLLGLGLVSLRGFKRFFRS